MSQAVVLCEGFLDRAFWAGWLKYLGCTDPGTPKPGSRSRERVYDPWRLEVKGGPFGFQSGTGKFIRISPCKGKSGIWPAARAFLGERGSKTLRVLVLNRDSDLPATGTTGVQDPVSRSLENLENLLKEFDPQARIADNQVLLDGSATRVACMHWSCGDPATLDLPEQQCLERVICASIAVAYPNRVEAVRQWLTSRPDKPVAGVKEHVWSHMAGWYAEYGCEAFFEKVWEDPRVRVELETRLRACGAWNIAESLAS